MDLLASKISGLIRRLALLALACLAPAVDPAFAADPVAILAAVRGDVRVAVAGASPGKKGNFGQPLAKGDRVSTAADAGATIFFHDGNVVELGENSSVTVGGGSESRGRTEIAGEVYTQVARYVTGGSRETGLVALSGMRSSSESAPIVLSPRKTSILGRRPTFSWRATEGATRYLVVVSSDDGELWRTETTADSLLYPEKQAELAAGADYIWEIEARSGSRSLAKESAVFHVMATGEAEAIRGHLASIESGVGTKSPAGNFLAGSYLSGKGLYQDAAERYRALVMAAPNSPDAHEALAGAYAAMGLMDFAAAEYRSALSLTRSAEP